MSDPTQDAYLRIQKMLSGQNETKTVIPNIALTGLEKQVLSNKINNKLVKHAKMPQYHADIISEYIVDLVADFVELKLKNAANDLNKPKTDNAFGREDD